MRTQGEKRRGTEAASAVSEYITTNKERAEARTLLRLLCRLPWWSGGSDSALPVQIRLRGRELDPAGFSQDRRSHVHNYDAAQQINKYNLQKAVLVKSEIQMRNMSLETGGET